MKLGIAMGIFRKQTTLSKMLFAALIGVTFTFNACASESGPEASNASVVSVVETSFELGTCTNEIEGYSVYVVQEAVNYVCTNGNWNKMENNFPEPPISAGSINPSSSTDSFSNENGSSDIGLSSSSFAKSSSSLVNNNQTLYGTFVDERDGKTYKYVTIRNQTWMAENLNYADSIKTPMLADGYSWCINHKEAYCELFGRFYTWQAAVDSLTSGCGMEVDCSSKVIQGICPAGWHIPTYSDIATLIKNVGGVGVACNVLKSKYWWHDKNGSDTYGFNFLPAGFSTRRHNDSIETVNITGMGYFWGMDSSAKYAYHATCHWKRSTYGINGAVYGPNHKILYGGMWKSPYKGLNVRCVKDSVDLSPSTRSKENLNVAMQKKTFTDKRDGKTYRYVTIGEQKWMAEDLRFDPGEGLMHTSTKKFDNQGCALGCFVEDTVLTYDLWYCSGNGSDTSYCRYSFAGAMDSVNTSCGSGRLCHEGASDIGVCPEGWKLPSREDFEELISYIGGEDIAGFLLRSMKVWTDDWDWGGLSYNYGGIDLYGFSAIPSSFMTSEEINKNQYYAYTMELESDDMHLEEREKSQFATVRCIMDSK